MDSIIVKYSQTPGVEPVPNQLLTGELVSNTYDGRLFMKKSDVDGDSIVSFVNFYDLPTATVLSASFSSTASFVTPLRQNIFITGSVNISGSTIQVGDNTIFGNTLLSGSVTISGSHVINSPTIKIYGDTEIDGAIKLLSVEDTIDTSISSSYIYVSGSTGDLYFSQNSKGYANTTRLRWLEGNLYTGLLNGGIITTTTGSTTFNISSGSGIVVSLNASLGENPYPTIKYVNWESKIAQPLTYISSSIQTFVGIDSDGNVIQQTSPWNDGQYNTSISIGTVLHQNKSTVNASITYPNVAYGYKQRTYDFIKAFGPLKLSGFNIIPSASLGITIGSGTAWADGRNYQVDPNNPSYITDSGTSVSKIFRYYQSGSEFVQDTSASLGYTEIDPANYNLNGTLTPVPGTGANREWSVKRVFWYPNSATKGIVVYYGNTTYPSATDAIAGFTYESFVETPNTQQNAIYVGAIAIRNNGSFTDSGSFAILPGGVFRNVGGSGGGGALPTVRLTDLSDVDITSPLDHQPLAYNADTLKFTNQSFLSASISGTAATASYALTASYVSGTSSTSSYALSASNAISSSYAITASYVLGGSATSSYAISSSYAVTASYVLGTSATSSYALSASQAVSSSYPVAITGSSIYTPLEGVYDVFTDNDETTIYGFGAGVGITSGHNRSTYIGRKAGYSASLNTSYATLIGALAGAGTKDVEALTAIGTDAGSYADSLSYSNAIGYSAGYLGYNLTFSNLIGNNAGTEASYSYSSNMFGVYTGYNSKYSDYSNFIGSDAGYFTVSASYSNLIGYGAGKSPIFGNHVLGRNNIIIGTNITLPVNSQDKINIGGLIFGSGSYFNASTISSGSANGKIGINQPNPLYNLDVSGSGNYTDGLTITGSLSATGSNHSLFGNVGVKTLALTASLEVNGSARITGSVEVQPYLNQLGTATTANRASLVVQPDEYENSTTSATTNAGIISSVTNKGSSSGGIGTYGGQFYSRPYGTSTGYVLGYGLSSFAIRNNALDTSTNASNGLYGLATNVGHQTSLNGLATTANVFGISNTLLAATGSITNTYGQTTSLTVGTGANRIATVTNFYGLQTSATVGATSGTGSGTLTNYYDIYLSGATVQSTGVVTNKWGVYQLNSAHSNYFAGNVGIGKIASSSLDVNGTVLITGSLGVTGGITGSLLGTATTASYVLQAISSSYSFSSSFASLANTASYVTTAQTASYVLQAVSASFATLAQTAVNSNTASYVVTAQTASYVLNSISASFAILSQNANTASFITTAQTASFVTTAQTASFVNTAQTASFATNFTASNILVNGTITAQTLVAQTVTSSIEYVTGSTRNGSLMTNTHQFTGSVFITGSLNVTNGITGSLLGTASTASFVTTAQTASYVLQAVSASYSTLAQTANTASFVTTAQTASYVLQAVSASYASTAPYSGLLGTVPTWNQNTTGNAATATILQTARNINGVSFNGSADIIVPSIYDSGYTRITNPAGGAYTTGTATVTGAIAVTLPVGMNSTMMRITIKVYEYATNESFEIHAGGYTYGPGTTWANNPFAYIVGNPTVDRRFTVRLGYNSTSGKAIIYIGELASTWSYPQVFVTEFQGGYGGLTSTLTSGWSIGFEASAFQSVTATISNCQVGYATSTNTANAVVLRDGSGNFTAGTITAALTGNASTATTLQTARSINGTSFNGSADITTTNWGTARTITIGSTGKSVNGSADVSWTLAEIGAYSSSNPSGYTSNTGTVTSVGGTGGYGGLTLSGTVTTSGSITLGGTPTGTWPISISGTATTASYVLQAVSASFASSATWASISGKPTTVSGYGITDFYSQVISGFVVGANSTVLNTDSLELAIEKLQGQINARGTGNGTVTSVGISVPTGLTVSGTPITTSGSFSVTFTSGYSIPTTASQTNWDSAFTERRQWDGGSTNLTAATGRTSLGATTVGSNVFTLTNPSAITFIRINADNTVSALDAATFRTAIGAGTSSTTGTVTSVGGSGGYGGLTLTGTVTASGSITLGGTPTGTWPISVSGTSATASFVTLAQTASYVVTAQTASFVNTARTASYVLNAVSASYAPSTPAFPFTGSAIISGSLIVTGSLAVGTFFASTASGENTLTVGLPSAGGVGEGGQILLQASGGLYTSASMLDTYQNKFRLLRGTNVSSDAEVFSADLQSKLITTAGGLTVGGTITENSSIRYKKDIYTITSSLDIVTKLRGVHYVNKSSGLQEIGLIAEEVEQIIPNVIGRNEAGEVDSVSYGRLTAVLIEAIKELKLEIESLKNK